MEQMLEQVKIFATNAHHGQVRKFADEPFVSHPIRVMQTCSNYTADLSILSAALLHDVIEDTAITRREIYDFLSGLMPAHLAQRTVHLVEQLTDVYIKSKFPHWNRRKRKKAEIQRLSGISADAQTIKYADIIDNCAAIIHHDQEFADRFLGECRDLLKKINQGNSVLYMRAKEVVHGGISELKLMQQKMD
ncbi:MAG TPA: HD domain-containing protein [Chitinophagaceae bacterium]